jgi:signal transduction histidine kinase
MGRRYAYPLQVVALTALYAVSAELGLAAGAVSGFATLLWPPSGIALAALLVLGYRLAPAVALGALLANLSAGAPPLVALGIAIGNTLEALLGAYVLHRFGFRNTLDRVRDVLALVVLAAFLSTVVSASIGVLVLGWSGIVPSNHLAETWRAWWLGDMTGDLLVTPPLLAWFSGSHAPLSRRRFPESIALGLTVIGVGVLAFFASPAVGAVLLHREYLLFPLFIWAALRFELRGVTATVLLACALAIAGTILGRGPFTREALHESLTHLQLFLAVAVITALLLGAVTSERRAHAREVARLYEQAQQAIRVRDEFLSIASHELRTPLSALVLQLASLQALLGDEVTPEQQLKLRQKLDRAVRATGRLTRLVESLLDVSRLAAGRVQIDLEDCDLAEVTREVIERVADEALRAGCELRVFADRPVTGRWDRLRLEQVLMNLLSNALKYGAGKPVEIRAEGTAKIATLTIRDYGIGISQVDIQRIFARFERAVPRRHYGGLGLGLYITQEIVSQHGGAIRVTSEPGVGSVFTVELPTKPALAAAENGSGDVPAAV